MYTTTTWADLTVIGGYANTAPVGSFPSGSSPYGALDMAGNVWEWTSSQYLAYPYQTEDGREDEKVVGACRVLRGGAWNYGAISARTASRFIDSPDNRNNSYGFRVVLFAPQ